MGNESCCASTVVPGGTYNRSNDANYPATVSDFRLDRFEVTVGRFRAFVEAYPGSKPAAGAGAHPLITGSGWDTAWDGADGGSSGELPADKDALIAAVKCSSQYQTSTDTPAGNENLPMNCMTWYEAFAFCVWDGGRLPTEAEWNYAAAGGAEQRVYPWSIPANSTTIGSTYAVYNGASIGIVGSKPAGDGKWGQADLSGNLWEWNLDWYKSPYPTFTIPCDNCANIQDASYRVIRGGGWSDTAPGSLSSGVRGNVDPPGRGYFIGARCARTP
jgi:formylglycine-generating enzyme required for sulfatase activity